MSNISNEQSAEAFFGEVISTYSRAQAIEDGVLIDAGSMASEAGFKWPVALTSAVWADCVAWTGMIVNSRCTRISRVGFGTSYIWRPTPYAPPKIRVTGCCSSCIG